MLICYHTSMELYESNVLIILLSLCVFAEDLVSLRKIVRNSNGICVWTMFQFSVVNSIFLPVFLRENAKCLDKSIDNLSKDIVRSGGGVTGGRQRDKLQDFQTIPRQTTRTQCPTKLKTKTSNISAYEWCSILVSVHAIQ